MPQAAMSDAPPPPPARRAPPRGVRMPEPPVAAAPKIAKPNAITWLPMDDDGPNPPPKDGKWLWLGTEVGTKDGAVEAIWYQTRKFSQEANGGRGGWVRTGWWAHRLSAGKRIEFEPCGWWPGND